MNVRIYCVYTHTFFQQGIDQICLLNILHFQWTNQISRKSLTSMRHKMWLFVKGHWPMVQWQYQVQNNTKEKKEAIKQPPTPPLSNALLILNIKYTIEKQKMTSNAWYLYILNASTNYPGDKVTMTLKKKVTNEPDTRFLFTFPFINCSNSTVPPQIWLYYKIHDINHSLSKNARSLNIVR